MTAALEESLGKVLRILQGWLLVDSLPLTSRGRIARVAVEKLFVETGKGPS